MIFEIFKSKLGFRSAMHISWKKTLQAAKFVALKIKPITILVFILNFFQYCFVRKLKICAMIIPRSEKMLQKNKAQGDKIINQIFANAPTWFSAVLFMTSNEREEKGKYGGIRIHPRAFIVQFHIRTCFNFSFFSSLSTFSWCVVLQ